MTTEDDKERVFLKEWNRRDGERYSPRLKKVYHGRYPKRITLRMTHYQYARLRELCFDLEMGVTSFLRALIGNAVREQERKE